MANLNLNKSIIGGRLTADPELQTTQNGISVCSFSIAVARKANREKTEYIRCVAWRNMAEFISKYFHKGSSICIIGNIQTRSWDDSDGKKQYATEVVVEETMFVDSKSDAQESATPSFDVPQGFLEIDDNIELPFK